MGVSKTHHQQSLQYLLLNSMVGNENQKEKKQKLNVRNKRNKNNVFKRGRIGFFKT